MSLYGNTGTTRFFSECELTALAASPQKTFAAIAGSSIVRILKISHSDTFSRLDQNNSNSEFEFIPVATLHSPGASSLDKVHHITSLQWNTGPYSSCIAIAGKTNGAILIHDIEKLISTFNPSSNTNTNKNTNSSFTNPKKSSSFIHSVHLSYTSVLSSRKHSESSSTFHDGQNISLSSSGSIQPKIPLSTKSNSGSNCSPKTFLCALTGHSRTVNALSFNTHQPALLASGSQEGTIKLWDLRSSHKKSVVNIFSSSIEAARDVKFSPLDSTRLAAIFDNGIICKWDIRMLAPSYASAFPTSNFSSSSPFSSSSTSASSSPLQPSHASIVSSSQPASMLSNAPSLPFTTFPPAPQLYVPPVTHLPSISSNISSFSPSSINNSTPSSSFSSSFHPPSTHSSSASNTPNPYPTHSIIAPERKFTAHSGPGFSLDWHPSANYIASGGRDRQIHVWNLNSDSKLPEFSIPTSGAVSKVAWRPTPNNNSFSYNGNSNSVMSTDIAATSLSVGEYSINIWSLAHKYIPKHTIDMHEAATTGILWHSDDLLWSCSKDKYLMQHDVTFSPKPYDRLRLQCLTWSPLNNSIAFALQSRTSFTSSSGATAINPHCLNTMNKSIISNSTPTSTQVQTPTLQHHTSYLQNQNIIQHSNSLNASPQTGLSTSPSSHINHMRIRQHSPAIETVPEIPSSLPNEVNNEFQLFSPATGGGIPPLRRSATTLSTNSMLSPMASSPHINYTTAHQNTSSASLSNISSSTLTAATNNINLPTSSRPALNRNPSSSSFSTSPPLNKIQQSPINSSQASPKSNNNDFNSVSSNYSHFSSSQTNLISHTLSRPLSLQHTAMNSPSNIKHELMKLFIPLTQAVGSIEFPFMSTIAFKKIAIEYTFYIDRSLSSSEEINNDNISIDMNIFEELLGVMESNARIAWDANRVRIAQTWRILALFISNEFYEKVLHITETRHKQQQQLIKQQKVLYHDGLNKKKKSQKKSKRKDKEKDDEISKSNFNDQYDPFLLTENEKMQGVNIPSSSATTSRFRSLSSSCSSAKDAESITNALSLGSHDSHGINSLGGSSTGVNTTDTDEYYIDRSGHNSVSSMITGSSINYEDVMSKSSNSRSDLLGTSNSLRSNSFSYSGRGESYNSDNCFDLVPETNNDNLKLLQRQEQFKKAGKLNQVNSSTTRDGKTNENKNNLESNCVPNEENDSNSNNGNFNDLDNLSHSAYLPTSGICPLSSYELIENCVQYYLEQGDIQMVTAIALVLGCLIKFPHKQLEEWISAYIDLLRRRRLDIPAAELVKGSNLDSVRKYGQINTLIDTSCSICKSPIINSSTKNGYWYCEKCRSRLNRCVVCHSPCKGLAVQFPNCGHMGHDKCMNHWFVKLKMIDCPSGCGATIYE